MHLYSCGVFLYSCLISQISWLFYWEYYSVRLLSGKAEYLIEYVRKLLLITAFLSYSIIVGKDRNTILMYAVFPVTFFFLGESVTKAFPEEKYRTGVLAAVVGGYTVHGILNSCIFFRDGISGVRGWADIWYQTFSPATQQIIFYLPMMALMFVSLYMVKKKTVPCLCLIAGNLFFLYVSFASLSRGSIVIWRWCCRWKVFCTCC